MRKLIIAGLLGIAAFTGVAASAQAQSIVITTDDGYHRDRWHDRRDWRDRRYYEERRRDRWERHADREDRRRYERGRDCYAKNVRVRHPDGHWTTEKTRVCR